MQEVLGEEKLRRQLSTGKIPHVYWGTAPTGRPHVAYLLPMMKIGDMLHAGCKASPLPPIPIPPGDGVVRGHSRVPRQHEEHVGVVEEAHGVLRARDQGALVGFERAARAAALRARQ